MTLWGFTVTQSAIIYARFSSAEQAKGDSLARQMTYGKEFVAANGWTLDAVIDDQGLSAFKGSNRLEGSALRQFELEADAGLHQGKVLAVENIDRLSRQGAKAAARLIWALNDAGVDVATWHDKHVYRAGEAGELMDIFSIVIKAQMSHEESANKSKRQNANLAKRYAAIADGDKTVRLSAHPAWLVATDDGYVLDEYRASVILEIYDWYLAGDGLLTIAQRLNARSEPTWATEKTSGWHAAYISRLLKSRQVLGEVVDRHGATISADHFPQVIDAKKFAAVQRIISTKKGTGGRDARKVNNLLAGLIVCTECQKKAGFIGQGNSTVKYVTAAGETRTYAREKYARVCCDSNRRKSGCTNRTAIPYKVIEDLVLNQLFELVAEDEMDLSEPDSKLATLKVDQAEAQRGIDVLQAKLDHLVDVIADGGAKALVTKVVELEAAIEAQTAALAAITSKVEAEEAKPKASDDMMLIAALRRDLDSEDADARLYARIKTKAALARVVNAIHIYPNDTFSVLAMEYAAWISDKKGKIIGGQML